MNIWAIFMFFLIVQLGSSSGDINSLQIVQVSWVSTICATRWRHLLLSWHCVSSRLSTSQWWMRSGLWENIWKWGMITSNKQTTTNIAMENGPFIEDLPIKMVIFYSYVELPEGTSNKRWNGGNMMMTRDSWGILVSDKATWPARFILR